MARTKKNASREAKNSVLTSQNMQKRKARPKICNGLLLSNWHTVAILCNIYTNNGVIQCYSWTSIHSHDGLSITSWHICSLTFQRSKNDSLSSKPWNNFWIQVRTHLVLSKYLASACTKSDTRSLGASCLCPEHASDEKAVVLLLAPNDCILLLPRSLCSETYDEVHGALSRAEAYQSYHDCRFL